MEKIPKAYTYRDLTRKKYTSLAFSGDWLAHIGEPERSGAWIIWGLSGQGKTSYALQLARYFSQFERVFYNSLEEGTKKTFKLAMERNNIPSVNSRFVFRSETYEKLTLRLSAKRMPKIVFIDSLQYFFRKKKIEDYLNLKERFSNTLFIFISHARGKHPKGDIADFIRYDSDVKTHVHNFLAKAKSRYEGKEPYIISQEKYNEEHSNFLIHG